MRGLFLTGINVHDSISLALFDDSSNNLKHTFNKYAGQTDIYDFCESNNLLAIYNNASVIVFAVSSGEVINSFVNNSRVFNLKFSIDGSILIVIDEENATQYDTKTWQNLGNFKKYDNNIKAIIANKEYAYALVEQEKWFDFSSADYLLFKWSLRSKRLLSNWLINDASTTKNATYSNAFITQLYNLANVLNLKFLNEESILVSYYDYFGIFSTKKKSPQKSFYLNNFVLSDINLQTDFFVSLKNSELKLNEFSSGNEIATIIPVFENEYFVKTPDNYYKTSKGSTKFLSFRLSNKLYGFEQFDLKYNRPDIVLERLGYASPELIDAYYRAYQKRLKKMGFTEEQLSGEFHIPESAIENFEYMPVIEEKDIEIELNFNDSKYKLDRYNIWINDVPLFGMTGKSLRNENTDTYKTKERIVLNEGRNKIQVSCLNEKGTESYKETVEITYAPKTSQKHDLYFVAVSVSEYEDAQFNLKYAVKDGRDMVKLFSDNRNGDFANIYIDTLFNNAATTENLISVKQKLMQSNVDDEEILYVSGHGLLDDNLDFYFASHNVDFSNPSVNGISYDALEGLLDGIPARKKLLLMDACHSGEVDKEDTRQEPEDNVLLADGQKSGLTTYSYKGAVIKNSSDPNKVGLQNSFDLMQELFANLNRGSGAVVISAAAGVGYALEGEQWNNGVFTYALLDGLYNQRADANGDKQVSLSELRTYVISEVDRLTNGRQRPTSRQENLEFDWEVW